MCRTTLLESVSRVGVLEEEGSKEEHTFDKSFTTTRYDRHTK